jgi:hypothetical protein
MIPLHLNPVVKLAPSSVLIGAFEAGDVTLKNSTATRLFGEPGHLDIDLTSISPHRLF